VEIFLAYAVVLGISVAIAAVIYLFSKSLQKGRALFWQLMQDTNEKHGTAFPTHPSGMDFVLSGRSGQAFIFDQKNRKIFYLTSPAQCKGEILDFSDIRYWVLQSETGFIGNTLIHKNVRIEFFTTDLKRPIIKIPAGAIGNGRNWDQKLQILFKKN
jgi:hypothetical protein